MTKGTLDGSKPQLATADKAKVKPRTGDMEDSIHATTSDSRIHESAEREGRNADKHGDSTDDVSTGGKPRVSRAVRKVRAADAPPAKATRRTYRLSPESVARIRARRLQTSIGELDDAFQAEQAKTAPTKQTLAIKSYDFGYRAGYAAGEEDQKEVHRHRERPHDPTKPWHMSVWQVAAIFLLGFSIALLFH